MVNMSFQSIKIPLKVQGIYILCFLSKKKMRDHFRVFSPTLYYPHAAEYMYLEFTDIHAGRAQRQFFWTASTLPLVLLVD